MPQEIIIKGKYPIQNIIPPEGHRRISGKFRNHVIMVLHDLNHAAHFSDRLIAVKKGNIVADGPVAEIFTEPVLSDLYEVQMVFTELSINGVTHNICVPYESR